MSQFHLSASSRLLDVDPSRLKGRSFELSKDQIQEIDDAFSLFDSDSTGYITTKKWKVAMKTMGFEPTKEENQQLLDEMDPNGTGTIDHNEFQNLIKKRLEAVLAREEMLKLFNILKECGDPKKTRISVTNLINAASLVDEEFSAHEFREMIEEADRDGDGEITEEDFVRVMKKTNIWNKYH